MIYTYELRETLRTIEAALPAPTQADADWARGAKDVVNLLITISERKTSA